jgi:hypothetical protein
MWLFSAPLQSYDAEVEGPFRSDPCLPLHIELPFFSELRRVRIDEIKEICDILKLNFMSEDMCTHGGGERGVGGRGFMWEFDSGLSYRASMTPASNRKSLLLEFRVSYRESVHSGLIT